MQRGATYAPLIKLAEKTNFVSEQVANISDLVPNHAKSLDAQAKGKASIFLRIDSDRFEHVRVDDPCTAELDPFTVPKIVGFDTCLLYTSPSPRDGLLSRMPSSA